MSERGAADRAASEDAADRAGMADVAQLVADRAGPAQAAGFDPRAAAATAIVDELAAAFAAAHGRVDDAPFRIWLGEQLQTFTDARAERYRQLLAVINGWPAVPATTPAWTWFAVGLRARS